MPNPVGRPTEYKEEYIRKIDTYLESCIDEEVQELTGLSAKGTELYRTKLKVSLPTVEGFARFIDQSKRVLYDWRDKYPEFLHALGKIEAEQQKRLLNHGLSGEYNPTIAKLILSSNHGMREKSDVTSDDKPLLQGVEITVRKSNDRPED